MIADIKSYYINALFFITGFIPYYLFGGIPFALLIMRVCGPTMPPAGSLCDVAIITMTVISILGLPIACAEFYRTGKWFWTEVLHVFPQEAS